MKLLTIALIEQMINSLIKKIEIQNNKQKRQLEFFKSIKIILCIDVN